MKITDKKRWAEKPTSNKMKNKTQYSRFILDGNAITCIYGDKIIHSKTVRGKFSLLKKLADFFLRRMNV